MTVIIPFCLLVAASLLQPSELKTNDVCGTCPRTDEAILPFAIKSKTSQPIFLLATVFGTDTRVAVTGKGISKWPVGRAERPDKIFLSGGFISPCLFLTAYHGLYNGPAAPPLDSLVISNETGPDGTFLYSENPVALKVVRSAEPKIDRLTDSLETAKDMVVLRDPLCRGGSSGYFEFDTLPVSGESKDNNFVMFSAAFDSINPATNGHKLVKGSGCNIKFRTGRILYFDCESTPGSSGAFITEIDSITNPKISPSGAPIWLAAGMNVEYPKLSNNGTCTISNCNRAIDGGAILDFAEDLILADIKSYEARSKSDTRHSNVPKILFH